MDESRAVIQSEVSQEERQIIYEHTRVESRRVVLMILHAGQEETSTDNGLWTRGRGGGTMGGEEVG